MTSIVSDATGSVAENYRFCDFQEKGTPEGQARGSEESGDKTLNS